MSLLSPLVRFNNYWTGTAVAGQASMGANPSSQAAMPGEAPGSLYALAALVVVLFLTPAALAAAFQMGVSHGRRERLPDFSYIRQ